MKNTLGDLKELVLKHLRGKGFSLSGGTVIFLAFNLLMIMGFCKFSFYVLKNHRSVVERDSLIKTYVDVQPQATNRKTTSSYLSLASGDKTAPAPFFIKRDETEIRHPSSFSGETPSLPVLNDFKKDSFSVAARTTARPPVIRTAVQTPAVSAEPVAKKEIIVKDESPAVSLDTLMASGLDLLNRSEESVITAAEHFLQEETPVETASIATGNVPAEQLSVVRENVAPATKTETSALPSAPKTAPSKKITKETRWVDVAELRRRLADELLKKNETKAQNTALLEMNNARQVASSETQTASDVTETVPLRKETVENGKETIATNSGTVPTNDESKQKTGSDTGTKQVAVVQDIPFSEMTTPSENAGKTAVAHPSANHKNTWAGNSPGLWKIAQVKGKTPAFAKGSPKTPVSKASGEPKDTAVQKDVPPAKQDMIYRNGKAVAVVQQSEKKSLNWLDRQEAAVWTSMSQSDTPSVWSADTEDRGSASGKARAFRVADEQPAPPEKKEEGKEKDQTVRTVETMPVPEAKENPLLLPLGNSATSTSPVPTNVSPAERPTVFTNPAVAVEGNKSPENAKKDTQTEDGLMNKLFSFFGKTDVSEGISAPPDSTVKTEPAQKNIPANTDAGIKNIKASGVDPNPFGLKTKTEEKQIVPTEMRLTFKPDSTEMSVQSIKWIKALGQKAKKDIQNAIEVRMSTTDPALQNKRFAIIRSTLLGVGVEDIQILPVSTDRTPHTIVLRMIVLPEEGYTEYTTEHNGVKERLYYKQW